MADTLLEVEIDPESNWNERTTVWLGKMTIDLTWVMSATPSTILAQQVEEGLCCQIQMAGSSQHISIRMSYPEFMSAWTTARKTLNRD